MLLNAIRSKLSTQDFEIVYPLQYDEIVEQNFVSDLQDCPAPSNVVLESDCITMTYELCGFKPLYQKALYYNRTTQAFAAQQIDALLAFLLELAAALASEGEILGLLTLQNVFYCDSKFRILGLLPARLLRCCPVLYYETQFVDFHSILPLKVVIYELVTARTPLVPFMSDFPIADVLIMSGSSQMRLKTFFASECDGDVRSLVGLTESCEITELKPVELGIPDYVLQLFSREFENRDHLAMVLEAMLENRLLKGTFVKTEK